MNVSVIVVTRNRCNMLIRAIESILSNETKANELIIIDNNSEDKTEEKIKKYLKKHDNIKYYKEKKVGISYARNLGLKKANGEIIIYTDDDCVVAKNWIGNIKKSHLKYPDAYAIGGKTLNYPNNLIGYCGHMHRIFLTLETIIGEKIDYKKAERTLDKPHYMSYLATQNISYKKNKIIGIVFRNDIDPVEAVDFSWKIYSRNKKSIIYDPEITVFHEYRKNLIELIKQNYEYGKKAKKLNKISRSNGYYCKKAVNPLQREINYIKFIYFYIYRNKIKSIDKIKIFILMFLREIAFAIPYYFS